MRIHVYNCRYNNHTGNFDRKLKQVLELPLHKVTGEVNHTKYYEFD